MLLESLEFFLTPTTPLARKYGFLYSSISLKHRYERCKKVWIPHLKNCQDLFLETVQGLPQKNHVVILGSAHLHEIPMHLLMQNFKQVTLVDIVHPLRHHWLAKRNSRLKLISQDLTAALQDLEGLKDINDLLHLTTELSKKPLFHFEADLIVSANLLSQLALLPIDAIEKKMKRELTVEEKDLICSKFARLHLDSLSQCQGKKLIYSDRKVIYKDPQGQIIYEGHYPVDFSDFKKVKTWTWTLAPLGEAAKDYSIEMDIEAYS
jgi:hypothetical protein